MPFPEFLRSLGQRCCDPFVKKYNQIAHRKKCNLTIEELNEYQTYTFFARPKIRKVYRIFHHLAPEVGMHVKNPTIEHEKILQLPALCLNPFRDRILKVFSSESDVMSFEEFLEMMSVFSEKASLKVKIEYAFRIYDFNEDNFIDEEDLRDYLTRVKDKYEFSMIDIEQTIENVMSEADLSADGTITFAEFEHALEKSPDFLHSFKIRL